MSPAAKARLHALFDLRIVRGRMGDEGFRELCQKQMAKRRYIPHQQPHSVEKCDYLITDKGDKWAPWVIDALR